MKKLLTIPLLYLLTVIGFGQPHFTNVVIGTQNGGGGDVPFIALSKINYALNSISNNLATNSVVGAMQENAGTGTNLSIYGSTLTGTNRVTARGASTARGLEDRFAETINVLDYGAVNGSGDDYSAITNAVAQLTSGTTLDLSKDLHLSASVTISASNIRVIGGTITASADIDDAMLTFTGTNVVVEGLILQGSERTLRGITLGVRSKVSIEKCKFFGFQQRTGISSIPAAIRIYGETYFDIKECLIVGVDADENGISRGIFVSALNTEGPPKRGVISKTRIEDITPVTDGDAICIQNDWPDNVNIVIRDCYLAGEKRGLKIMASGVMAEENFIPNSGYAGISIYAGNVKVSGNVITNHAGDMGIEIGSNVSSQDGVQVKGNFIYREASADIVSTGDGIRLIGTNLVGVTLSENLIRRARNGINITGASMGATVSGNKIFDAGVNAIKFASQTISSTTYYPVGGAIFGNTFSNITSTPISLIDSSDLAVFGNQFAGSGSVVGLSTCTNVTQYGNLSTSETGWASEQYALSTTGRPVIKDGATLTNLQISSIGIDRTAPGNGGGLAMQRSANFLYGATIDNTSSGTSARAGIVLQNDLDSTITFGLGGSGYTDATNRAFLIPSSGAAGLLFSFPSTNQDFQLKIEGSEMFRVDKDGLHGSGSSLTIDASGSTTARTLADRFGEVYNVMDYGALGDGSNDDTAEIQAALDAAGENGKVIFPKADDNYLISAALKFRNGQIIEALGGNGQFNTSNTNQVTIRMTGSGTNAIFEPYNTSADTINVQIKNLKIQGNGSTYVGVKMYRTSYSVIENCLITDCEVGVEFDANTSNQAYFNTIRGGKIAYNDEVNVRFKSGANANRLYDVWLGGAPRSVELLSSSVNNEFHGVHFQGVASPDGTSIHVYADAAHNTLFGGWVEACGTAIYETSNANVGVFNTVIGGNVTNVVSANPTAPESVKMFKAPNALGTDNGFIGQMGSLWMTNFPNSSTDNFFLTLTPRAATNVVQYVFGYGSSETAAANRTLFYSGTNNTAYVDHLTGAFIGSGASLTLDASGFNGNLTTGDNTLQEVAQALDDLIGGGSQTPWTSDIDGGGFSLTNVASIEFDEGYFGTLYLSNIVAGSLLKVVDDGSGNVYVTNAVAGVDYPAVPEILTTVTDGSTNLVDSDAIYDAIAAGGGSSPTTTRGDLIRRGAATDERLAVGSFGDGLLSDGTDPAWYAPQNYVRRFDDFTTTSGTVIGETGWTSALANSGTAAAGTGESGRPGVWVLSTTTSGTASALLVRQFLSDVFGGGVMRFECSIKLSALSDGTDTYTAMFGWFDTSSTSPTDGAYIRYTHSVNSGNWQGITRSNSSETPVNGSVAASTSWTKLGIQVAADGSSVEFFVDGVSIGTSSATIPTGAGRETGLRMGIIKSAGTTARTVSLDYTSELFKPTSTR
jgi:hypothetical protein